LTGLIVLLPVVLTAYVLIVIFRFADGILGSLIEKIVGFYVPGIGFVLSLVIVLFTGFLTTVLLGKRIFIVIENIFLRFPLVRQIYPSAKQIINFLFSKDKPQFRKVVLVEYPRKGIWSMGFITNETVQEIKTKTGQDLLNVFIPGSPGPLTGYFMFVPKQDIIFLDMTVEDGLKLIISGGVVNP
jgi:uncharacterized membrane protein